MFTIRTYGFLDLVGFHRPEFHATAAIVTTEEILSTAWSPTPRSPRPCGRGSALPRRRVTRVFGAWFHQVRLHMDSMKVIGCSLAAHWAF